MTAWARTRMIPEPLTAHAARDFRAAVTASPGLVFRLEPRSGSLPFDGDLVIERFLQVVPADFYRPGGG